MSMEYGLSWKAVKRSTGQEVLEPEVSSPFGCYEYIPTKYTTSFAYANVF